jgi:flagellar FliL protein
MQGLIDMRSIARILAGLFTALLTSAAPAADEAEVDIAYYALKPSIVSNLAGGPKYIRCDVQLMTEAASELPDVELHSPALRHAILMLIAAQDGKQLQTREGKESLRQAALASVQSQLEELTGRPIVNDLYFTAYYVK